MPSRAPARPAASYAVGAIVSLGIGVAALGQSACSSSTLPPLLGSDDDNLPSDGGTSGAGNTSLSGTSGGGSSDAAVGLGTGKSGPQMCNLGPDGGVCACADVAPLTDPPNMYFVLDRSSSMSQNNKWSVVRTVVKNIVVGIGPRAYFGAALFPGPSSSNDCVAGGQVFPLTQGDSPAGSVGPAVTALDTATNVVPTGGTPTAATLTALLPVLKALKGKTYIILATDGGPNCGDETSCPADQCIPNIESASPCSPGGNTCCDPYPTGYGGANCLDVDPTVQAVQALAAAGIPTYVVGIPGSAPYASVLDQLATAGGTAKSVEPLYYAASSANQTDIQASLSAVAAKIVGSCTVTLSTPPLDPSLVNVYLDSTVLPKDPTNGWSISGSTVTLLGTACSSVLAGNVLDVRVVAGCPTVIR